MRLGLSEAEVRDALWKRFDGWMTGQTYALDPQTDEPRYYQHDVELFLEMCPRPHQGVAD